ncbi:MAG TPA: hypothetical protein VK050_09635 [Flavobacteriaceae bacterium]|nr:hypothetical protein [Flavobacteriaceae bacterium]
MRYILLLSFLLFSGLSYSQIGIGSSSINKQNKWRVGGGLGMSFGDHGAFTLNISPFIGYELVSSLEGGVTTGYQYSKYRDQRQNLFSIGPYLNFYPMQSLFVRTQYEYFTGNSKIKNSSYSSSFDESALWIGGGYRTGGRVQMYAGIMYNVLYKENKSLFSEAYQPIVGISIGL